MHTLVQFYEEHTSPFLGVKYATIAAAPVNCARVRGLSVELYYRVRWCEDYRVRWCESEVVTHECDMWE